MGPLATDVVVVPLPADATGRIRLRLARGHWRIDYLASARLGARVEPFAVEPSVAGARTFQPAQAPLVTRPGDVHTYAFSLPPDAGRYELFLESQGYYLEWMRDEWLPEENPARAAQLVLNPEQLLRDVAPEFKKRRPGWKRCSGGAAMRAGDAGVALTFAVAAACAPGCTGNPAPREWRPPAAVAQRSSRGGWITIEAVEASGVRSTGRPLAEGELVAIEETAFHVLTTAGLQSVARASAHRITLVSYGTLGGTLALWAVAGGFSTLSHGRFLLTYGPHVGDCRHRSDPY